MTDGFKRVSIEGLPKEDGSYIILLLLEEHRPMLFLRYTNPDGSVMWIGTDRSQIQEQDISLYKKVLITSGRIEITGLSVVSSISREAGESKDESKCAMQDPFGLATNMFLSLAFR